MSLFAAAPAAADPYPADRDVLQAAIEDALDRVDQPRARRLSLFLIRNRPSDPLGYEGLGRLYAQQSRFDDAEIAFTRALACDPKSFWAHVGLGLCADFARDYETADKWMARARALQPWRWEATGVYGRVKFKSGDMDSAVELFWLTQDLAPLRGYGHIYPGNGFISVRDPISTDAIEADGDPLARVAYNAAREALIAGDEATAGAQARLARQIDPAYFGGHFILGLIERRHHNYDAAIAHLTEAARVGRGHPLVHNALGVALGQRQTLRHAVEEWPEYRAFKAALPDDVDVPQVQKLIPRYPSLPLDVQATVRRALAPFRRFVPAVVRNDARHDILTLSESIIHSPVRRWLKDRRTMDKRRYDDVRGVGGKIAATSIEDVEQAANSSFNTLAHEFAHQVHQFALSDDQKAKVEALYQAAVKYDLCLDYYAAHNEFEYFAQGYEAYVSFYKRPGSSLTGRHCRFELQAKDPALFVFIDSIADRSVLEGADWDAALAAATACLRRSSQTDDAARAMEWNVQRLARR